MRIMDLAFVRLVARGHCGDLHMADQRQIFFEALDQITPHDLQVIAIKLDADVDRADRVDDVRRMVEVTEEIAGPVARIDRLDQEHDV